MRKTLAFIISLILMISLAACGAPESSGTESSDELAQHTIAVLVYDRTDDEVISFKKYLEDYIGEIFNVQFLYSDTITSGEEALAFIKDAAEYGAEGIMSFNSYDLAAEVALCAENKMYFMMASGTVADKVFAAVEDNEYFVGVTGPGSFIEYKAGCDLANHFLEKKSSDEYFILSGGGCLGNEMHRLRTEGILDTLQNAYGVQFGKSSEEIAVQDSIAEYTEGNLKVVVCPGYFSIGDYLENTKEQYKKTPYKAVLSVLPATKLADVIKGAKLGVIDCYSESNLQMFNNGTLDYVCGKYSSIIGPSFAAMYNAITGYEKDMRVNGKAFHLTQGFWASDSKADYTEKYALASSIERNAYNYEDLQQVIRVFNENATFDDLKKLAEAYSFEAAMSRRMP